MTSYAYEAVNAAGSNFRGTIDVASQSEALQRIKDIEPQHAHLMVIGHNPGMHALALELTGGGERKEVAALATEFPTAALAVLTFDATRWSEIKTASGRLEHFVTPRRLAA